MRQRVITAVAALALFLPIIYFDFKGISVALLAAALAGVGVYELFRMKGLTVLSFEGVLAIIGAVILALPRDPWFTFLPEGTDKFALFYFIVLLFLGISVVSKNMYTIDEAAFPVITSLYVGMGFGAFANARAESLVVLCFGLFIVWATDIGAYMVGREYGKNKLWPEISPNKTIEGALGGILSAIVVAIIYLIAFPAKEYFGYDTLPLLAMTAVFSVVGQFGDLVESAFKRHYGVKDSGIILPGHGGILDRFDSLLFVFPVMHLFGIF
ncbi:phosphatidate cytidylyltransferase [Enterococcus sp.]|uniref:phosphatidate cytidylyltransferase n=1 Tax=Enterococcus sp. TaxID=35783 RepID=UPI002FC6C006